MSVEPYAADFSDAAFEEKVATQVNIYADSDIGCVWTVYSDNSQTQKHGGGDYRWSMFTLQPGEVIIQVFTWSLEYENGVQGLQFITNTGRISERWGNCNGVAKLHQKISHKDGLPAFCALSGFQGQVLKFDQGKVDGMILSLNPLWSIVPTYYGGRFLQLGERTRGVDTATKFNDTFECGGILTAHLVGITMQSSGMVNSIQFTYDNGISTGSHGGEAGTTTQFVLGSGDFITQIDVRCGDWIDQLQFLTDSNKSSKAFGGETGIPMVLQAPTKDIPENLIGNIGLLGFIGCCDDRLRNFQPIWASMAPVSYELISVTYDNPPPDTDISQKIEPWGNFQLINDSDITRTDSAQYTKTYSTTYTHTFTDETAASIGMEVSFSVGVPEIAEMGGKITANLTQTDTVTNGQEQVSTWTATIPVDLTVEPRSVLETTCVTLEAYVASIPWTGKMKAVLYNGQTQIFDVSGTLTGGLTSILQVRYMKTPIAPDTLDEVRKSVALRQKRSRMSRL